MRARVGRNQKCQPNRLVILTEHPVSVWQNAMVVNADGTPGVDGVNRLVDSRIHASVSEDISSVILMVDTTATGGATFGQVADYIAMVSLARIDLDADFGNTGSIPRVFAKNAQGAPKRLTNWDHAFLKALYQPDRALLRPRTYIMVTMREELAP